MTPASKRGRMTIRRTPDLAASIARPTHGSTQVAVASVRIPRYLTALALADISPPPPLLGNGVMVTLRFLVPSF
jgi:hypothetical protein